MAQNMLDIPLSSLPTDIALPHYLGPDVQSHSPPGDSRKQPDDIEAVANGPARPRKDSGYSEEPRRPIYSCSSHSGTLTFLELQRDLDNSIARKSSTLRSNSRRDSSTTSIRKPKHRSSQGRLQENEKVKPAGSLHQQPETLTPPNNSTHEISRASNSQLSTQHSNPTQQKSILLVQTSELLDSAISSATTSRTASILTLEPLHEQSTRSDSSISTIDLEAHMSSPFYTATTIDWTDPNTRRKAYEKHDRDQKGLRRLLKKLTPRRWQAEQLQFYDGDSDAGSVRRYRLDIDGMESRDRARLDKGMGKILRQSRYPLACFPVSKSMSRVSSEKS